jgi:aspartate aminotransferase
LELREAVCFKFKRDNNLDYKPSQVVVSTGAKQSIANVCQVLLNPGDEVLLPAPFWVTYPALTKLCEATFKAIPSSVETDFKITPQQLEAAITPKTKMVFFNSPNNPSGSVYSEKEYRALAEILEKYPDIFILSDEIYEHISYGAKNFSFASIPSMYDRTITVNGVAKAFAMTGWRIGYIGAPEWIAKACTKMQGQITSGANSIAQRAVITALSESPSRIQYMVDEFRARRDLILDLLNDIEGFKANIPEGAFYVFPDVSYFIGKTLKGKPINSAMDFSLYLLEEAHVATVSGEDFGAGNCIRISYAASEDQIIDALKRIKNAVS